MTEKLKQMLHERTDSVDFAMPDLDALSRAGDRRIRRRRLGGVAAGAAAAVVAATVTVSALSTGGDHESLPVVRDPNTARVITWSIGPTIHRGDEKVDVGHTVDAFVETSAGFVVADPDGVVYSVVDGEVFEVGQTDERLPRVVSDPDGPLAGWVEVESGRPGFVVLDQRTGETTRYDEHTEQGMGTLADEGDPAYFFDIDGRTAYWRDLRGAVAVDLESGDVRVLDAEAPSGGFTIPAVHDGVIAWGGSGTTIGASPSEGLRLPEAYGSTGVFSPNGDYYSSEGDEPSVWDLATGKKVRLDLREQGYFFGTGYDWLGDGRLAAIAIKNERSLSIMECAVPEGTCEEAVEIRDLARIDFALPVGTGTSGN